MATPDTHSTFNGYAVWTCVVCGEPVGTEWVGFGPGSRRLFRPASRYWHDDGVFCGAIHSLQYHHAMGYPSGASGTGSNLRPVAYEATALPAELHRHETAGEVASS